MELFKGCTDFHIGGDEYMEFDRAPFTTQYKEVLDNYARENIDPNATWKDVIAKYINDLAEHVHKKDLLHVSGMMVSTMEKIPGDRINR